MTAELDIVIPVYNEGENIIPVLESLRTGVKTPFRAMICYDFDEDTTLQALRAHPMPEVNVALVRNRGKGAFGAVMTGLEDSSAPAVLVFPADDDYNAARIDLLMEKFREGCDVVAASRFMRGGCMTGAPWLKATLVRTSAFVLYHVARLPVHDASNGLRLFSQRVLRTIAIESTMGFTYSIELLVKSHRLGWRIGEAPFGWYERQRGGSRFRVLKWLPEYLKWFFYAFATTYLFRGPKTVKLKTTAPAESVGVP